jgi:uncharacterized protein
MPKILGVRLCLMLALGALAAGTPAAAAEPTLDLAGHWEGEIALPTGALQVMLDFTAAGDGWSGTIDIPAQSAAGLPLVGIAVDGDHARFTIDGVPGAPTFDGSLRDGELRGDFTQGAARLAFRLGREAVERPLRPQDPRPPLPYREEEVTYTHGDVTLAGTLTLPPGDGPFPAAVLITGSGPQNRDEEIFDHRPFRVLADALTRRGIAVLRSDDRGVGGSTGDVNSVTTADFAGDVLAGVALVGARADIASDRIGLVGHSEGGLVAPLAAVDSDRIAFLVLLSTPGISGAELLPMQNRRLAEAAGADPATLDAQLALLDEILALLAGDADDATLRPQLEAIGQRQLELGGEAAREALGDHADAFIAQQIDQVMTPWFRYFLSYDPRPTLRRLRMPVLVIQGERDLQVDADQNLPQLESALADDPDVTLRRFPGLNHLLQHAEAGTVEEYGQIEETMSPEVLQLIGDWIVARFGDAAG